MLLVWESHFKNPLVETHRKEADLSLMVSVESCFK